MTVKNIKNIKNIIKVERALEDLRRGMPIFYIDSEGQEYVLFAAETISYDLFRVFLLKQQNICLVLSKYRMQSLYDRQINHNYIYKINDLEQNLLDHLAAITFNKNIDLPLISDFQIFQEQAIIDLLHFAEIIPAALIIKKEDINRDFLNFIHDLDINILNNHDIKDFDDNYTPPLKEILDAPLTLQNENKARIKAFRSEIGGKEHYAIIVGNPLQDKAPLVRVHSSCYTGDLLRSMACDCHDQLISAIQIMQNFANDDDNKFSGGVIVYLLQEGRGIGLTNKLRAYILQAQGLDTVEANHHLGLDDEKRLFSSAANILQEINLHKITLLTNNPLKGEQLEGLGITIDSTMPHLSNINDYNRNYLKTKSSKMRHKIVI